ncbi:MAG TPA: glutathione-disulfide reductase [Nodosilinea sp.]|nr:glutathione-disulfide reductase [Nodosilinea sp.]
MATDFDLFVIGGGSGGIAAARQAAKHGARVGLAEANRLGGTCVNRGCVPKKLMVYAAQFAGQFEAAAGYGWRLTPPQFDWPTLTAAVDGEVNRLGDLYKDRLEQSGVQLFGQRARFVDGHTLAVGEATVTAAKILIAVGGRPTRPDTIAGIDLAITSDDVFQLPQQPRQLAIIGGGYIGSEFACIFHGLGTEVVQIIRSDKILRGFDDDLRQAVHGAMEQRGIRILTHSEPIALTKTEAGVQVTVSTPQGEETVCCDAVSLAATGRQPNLEGLGLHHTEVEVEDGAIVVDAHHRTTVPHIFAVGDVTNRVNLTPVAVREGRGFADAEFGHQPSPMAYDAVPSAVFTSPEIGTVGLSEAAAREKFGEDICTYDSRFQPLYYALTEQSAPALVKLVVQRSTERVLGAHMVGDHAAEIMQGVAIALTMGATKADFDATLAIHPSSAEEWVTMG